MFIPNIWSHARRSSILPVCVAVLHSLCKEVCTSKVSLQLPSRPDLAEHPGPHIESCPQPIFCKASGIDAVRFTPCRAGHERGSPASDWGDWHVGSNFGHSHTAQGLIAVRPHGVAELLNWVGQHAGESVPLRAEYSFLSCSRRCRDGFWCTRSLQSPPAALDGRRPAHHGMHL